MNLGIISPSPLPISGLCAIRVSSVLSVEISYCMLIIFTLGFRGLYMCVSILSTRFSVMLSPGSQTPGSCQFLSALSRPLVF